MKPQSSSLSYVTCTVTALHYLSTGFLSDHLELTAIHWRNPQWAKASARVAGLFQAQGNRAVCSCSGQPHWLTHGRDPVLCAPFFLHINQGGVSCRHAHLVITKPQLRKTGMNLSTNTADSWQFPLAHHPPWKTWP